jgi:hypothetical protein
MARQAQGNGMTLADAAAAHMPPGQNMQVAGNDPVNFSVA